MEKIKPLMRGLSRLCPACGKGRLFTNYLSVNESCTSCKTPLSSFRVDDAPAYFTIFIVGHLIIPGVFFLERYYAPESWIHMSLWIPLTLFLTLFLLPRIKGVILGLHWMLKIEEKAGS